MNKNKYLAKILLESAKIGDEDDAFEIGFELQKKYNGSTYRTKKEAKRIVDEKGFSNRLEILKKIYNVLRYYGIEMDQ